MVKQKSQENVAFDGGVNPAADSGADKKDKNLKLLTVITYAIALLCMLGGLFAPLMIIEGAKITQKMLFAYSIGIVNTLVYPFMQKELIKVPDGGFFIPFGEATNKLSPEALALTIFMIVCVVGIIVLIPVICGKKEKRGYIKCAFAVETLAALSSGFYVLWILRAYQWGGSFVYYNMLLAFGGSLLMMCIQSVAHKGSLGVGKIVLLILSGLIFLFLFNPTALFSEKVGGLFDKLSDTLKLGSEAIFSTAMPVGIVGLDMLPHIGELLSGGGQALAIVATVLGLIIPCWLFINLALDIAEIASDEKLDKEGLPSKNKGMSVRAILRYAISLLLVGGYIVVLFLLKNEAKPGLLLYIVAALVLVQLIFCIIRAIMLSKKHKKAEEKKKQADEERHERETTPQFEEYSEESTAASDTAEVQSENTEVAYEQPAPVEAPAPAVAEEPAPVVAEEPATAEAPSPYSEPLAATEEPVAAPVEEPAPYSEPIASETAYQTSFMPIEEPAPAPYSEPVVAPVEEPASTEEQLGIPGIPAPVQSEPVNEQHTYVYTYRPKYEGPTDKFMDTLDDAEKIEFVQLFLEKTKGKIKGVPDYKLGGDNTLFFSSIFIHINRSRELISSKLLEKIYKQLNN